MNAPLAIVPAYNENVADLRHVLTTANLAGCTTLTVWQGALTAELEETLEYLSSYRVVTGIPIGKGGAVRRGLSHLTGGLVTTGPTLVLDADLPGLTVEVVRELAEQASEGHWVRVGHDMPGRVGAILEHLLTAWDVDHPARLRTNGGLLNGMQAYPQGTDFSRAPVGYGFDLWTALELHEREVPLHVIEGVQRLHRSGDVNHLTMMVQELVPVLAAKGRAWSA